MSDKQGIQNAIDNYLTQHDPQAISGAWCGRDFKCRPQDWDACMAQHKATCARQVPEEEAALLDHYLDQRQPPYRIQHRPLLETVIPRQQPTTGGKH